MISHLDSTTKSGAPEEPKSIRISKLIFFSLSFRFIHGGERCHGTDTGCTSAQSDKKATWFFPTAPFFWYHLEGRGNDVDCFHNHTYFSLAFITIWEIHDDPDGNNDCHLSTFYFVSTSQFDRKIRRFPRKPTISLLIKTDRSSPWICKSESLYAMLQRR